MGIFQQLGIVTACKLIYDCPFLAAYDLADVPHDVFSTFLLNQVLIFHQIGDRFFDCSP